MNNNQKKIAEALGVDPSIAAQVPDRMRAQAFFSTLAKHGIAPGSEEEAAAMLEASDRLESKLAAARSANNPVNQTLTMLLGERKQASSPNKVVDLEQHKQQIAKEASIQVDNYLQDPHVFGALLTAFAE